MYRFNDTNRCIGNTSPLSTHKEFMQLCRGQKCDASVYDLSTFNISAAFLSVIFSFRRNKREHSVEIYNLGKNSNCL